MTALDKINNGLFEPNKEYKIVKGFIVDNTGKTGAVVYDVTSILIGGKAALKSLSKIKGSQLNSMVEESIRASQSTGDVVNSSYELSKDLQK